MDEKYLSIFDSYSKYLNPVSRAWRDIEDTGLRVDTDSGEIHFEEYIADLDTTAVQESLKKLEKMIKDGPKANKKLTLAETMELLKKGLKPYFYDAKLCKLAELNMENEESASDIKWLHPKMAEKINERYAEITKLEVELFETTNDTHAKIKDLQARIKDIEEKGTDLIL